MLLTKSAPSLNAGIYGGQTEPLVRHQRLVLNQQYTVNCPRGLPRLGEKMLLELFQSGFSKEALISLILFIPTILISLTVHEYCHGYVAYLCGDNTAKWNGRLTLNPIKHLDPIGTLMMLLFGFGYARPVPINPRNFRKYKFGLCAVSIAGPLSNILLALIGALALYISATINGDLMLNYFFDMTSNMEKVWLIFIINFIYANAALAVFNLLPIPPLDGSRIVSSFLPATLAYYYNKYENYIMLIVLALLCMNILDGVIGFLCSGVLKGIEWLVELIPFFENASIFINF